MNAIEAIIYCLGFVSETAEDGEYHSQVAYDKNMAPHWISWKNGLPGFRSESPTPFLRTLEPYVTTAIVKITYYLYKIDNFPREFIGTNAAWKEFMEKGGTFTIANVQPATEEQ